VISILLKENGKTQQLKMGGYLTTKKQNNMNRYDTISTSVRTS
jgi:hypothetical protein